MAQLLSYAAFHDRLRQEMQPGQGTLSVIAVIVVNLDFVSRLDGAMGYRAGDAVSGEQLHRLALALRDSDAVAEVSRTELACLLSRLPSRQSATNSRAPSQASPDGYLHGLGTDFDTSPGDAAARPQKRNNASELNFSESQIPERMIKPPMGRFQRTPRRSCDPPSVRPPRARVVWH